MLRVGKLGVIDVPHHSEKRRPAREDKQGQGGSTETRPDRLLVHSAIDLLHEARGHHEVRRNES